MIHFWWTYQPLYTLKKLFCSLALAENLWLVMVHGLCIVDHFWHLPIKVVWRPDIFALWLSKICRSLTDIRSTFLDKNFDPVKSLKARFTWRPKNQTKFTLRSRIQKLLCIVKLTSDAESAIPIFRGDKLIIQNYKNTKNSRLRLNWSRDKMSHEQPRPHKSVALAVSGCSVGLFILGLVVLFVWFIRLVSCVWDQCWSHSWVLS